MSIFSNLAHLDSDPIFQLKNQFDRDPRTNKVDLGIGMYRDESGASYLFDAVLKAEAAIQNTPHDYLPISGDAQFLSATKNLLFAPFDYKMSCIQTAGGTGALFLIGNLMKEVGFNHILLPSPTWSNHELIFSSQGFTITQYPYFNLETHTQDFANTFDFLKKSRKRSILLVHGCCHNPSGIDFTLDQWKELLQIAKSQKFFVIFDVAYHGFGSSLSQDIQPLKLFFHEFDEIALCYSFSKNFGLYGQRLGTLFIKSMLIDTIQSNLNRMQRICISNPPLQGSRIVTTILTNPSLKQSWQKELALIQKRLSHLRTRLKSFLTNNLGSLTFLEELEKQKGLFCFLPFSKKQVLCLREEKGLYFPTNGRINISSLNETNFDSCLDAIIAVLKKNE